MNSEVGESSALAVGGKSVVFLRAATCDEANRRGIYARGGDSGLICRRIRTQEFRRKRVGTCFSQIVSNVCGKISIVWHIFVHERFFIDIVDRVHCRHRCVKCLVLRGRDCWVNPSGFHGRSIGYSWLHIINYTCCVIISQRGALACWFWFVIIGHDHMCAVKFCFFNARSICLNYVIMYRGCRIDFIGFDLISVTSFYLLASDCANGILFRYFARDRNEFVLNTGQCNMLHWRLCNRVLWYTGGVHSVRCYRNLNDVWQI